MKKISYLHKEFPLIFIQPHVSENRGSNTPSICMCVSDSYQHCMLLRSDHIRCDDCLRHETANMQFCFLCLLSPNAVLLILSILP